VPVWVRMVEEAQVARASEVRLDMGAVARMVAKEKVAKAAAVRRGMVEEVKGPLVEEVVADVVVGVTVVGVPVVGRVVGRVVVAVLGAP